MIDYPPTPRGNHVDQLHGEEVADPYRWLEETGSEATADWVRAQNACTEAYLSAIPQRTEIVERLTALWDFPRLGAPSEHGGLWWQHRNTGLQDQSVLWVADAPGAPGRVLLDPNTLSADGTVALSGLSASEDGALLAWATSAGGSDWQTWRVRDVASGADLPDTVEWSKFSGAAWAHDGSGFYYVAPPAPAPGEEHLAETRRLRVRFHALGTAQEQDALVWSADHEPEWLPHAEVSDDGRYLVVTVNQGTRPQDRVEVLDLHHPEAGFSTLVEGFDVVASVVAVADGTAWLRTDADADRGRVVAVDLADPARDRWREVVPQSDDTLSSAAYVGGRLLLHHLHHAQSRLTVVDLDGGRAQVVPLPVGVSVTEVSGRHDSDVVHVSTTSFTDSGTVWRLSVADPTALEVVHPAGASTPGVVTEQVFVTSPDGTQVPVFLVRREDVVPDGDVRVLLYGYGGFSIPMTPAFSVSRALWVERGGVLAVACLRGGGEYGQAWYDAGRRERKQNVFDDFAAVARWLTTSGWSRPARIGVNGGSNGGLLVGATLTQHPELIGAAVPEVGVLDMLRFHEFTIGWAWTSDYGDPEDPEQYRWVRAYSPLHHVAPGRDYPPTLVTTGDTDDRVVPGHSYKFAAALQHAQPEGGPLLLRVDVSAGHGAGKPTSKVIAERADVLAFLEHALSG